MKKRVVVPALAGLVLCAGSIPAMATGLSGDFIVGQWSSPIFTGYSINPVTNQLVYSDNTATGVYTITNAATNAGPSQPSTLTTGEYPNSPFPVPQSSSIIFTGGIIPATHESSPFVIGGIDYTNGTSLATTSIYGATLTLYASNGFETTYLGTEQVRFNFTNNVGTPEQNADYLTFSGLAGQSFNVLEGATAAGALNGLVIGDPWLSLTSLSIDQGSAEFGFIGNNSPLGTPEPGTIFLLGIGLAGLVTVRRRNRR